MSEADLAMEFESCWSRYPDKSGKMMAFQSFKKARARGVTVEQILAGIERYFRYVENKRQNGFRDLQFKNGKTWFNQECWNDEYTIIAVAAPQLSVKELQDQLNIIRKDYEYTSNKDKEKKVRLYNRMQEIRRQITSRR